MHRNINTIFLCLQSFAVSVQSDLFLSINLVVTGLALTEIVQEMKNWEWADKSTYYKYVVSVGHTAQIKKKYIKKAFL